MTSLQLAWGDFLSDLESREGSEAIVDVEWQGAFLRFRSRLIKVDRPASCNAEAARRFGVVPQYVTLSFANGVRINLYMRHVRSVKHYSDGIAVCFGGEPGRPSSIALYSEARKGWRAG